MFAGSFALRLENGPRDSRRSTKSTCSTCLASLVDRSLVHVEDLVGRTGCRLLESVRAFALDEVVASGERALVAARVLERMLNGERS